MIFNSIESVTAYVEMVLNSAMPKTGEDIKQIMDEVTQDQVKGWTYQMFDSVESDGYGHEAYAEFRDNGHWESIITGESVGNPIKFLEAGTTWNRGASNIMDESFSRCKQEIPEKLKKYLVSRGIPIE
ncbi:MAG: hypothetical protein ACRCTZ_18250 [Sarcina sp.]